MKFPRRPNANPGGTMGAMKPVTENQCCLHCRANSRIAKMTAEKAAVKRNAALPHVRNVQDSRAHCNAPYVSRNNNHEP